MAEYGRCASCGIKKTDKACLKEDGKAPAFCCTKLYKDVLDESLQKYREDPEIEEFARQAALQEAACYVESPFGGGKTMPIKPRILEIIEFCQRMGYKKLGLAFCTALDKEAGMLVKVLESHGFQVVSAVCKSGAYDKCELGIQGDEKIKKNTFEPICNPIGQAMICNQEKTDFNLVLGLCVGHDSLFLKHSDAMCTIAAAKDRLMGHNPLAALYTGHSFYSYLEKE